MGENSRRRIYNPLDATATPAERIGMNGMSEEDMKAFCRDFTEWQEWQKVPGLDDEHYQCWKAAISYERKRCLDWIEAFRMVGDRSDQMIAAIRGPKK